MAFTNLPPQFANVIGQLSLDDIQINQAFEYYHQRFMHSDLARVFVNESERIPKDVRNSEFIGYCDRTMGKSIPPRRSFEGGAIRGALQRCGLVRASGHELFRGCVVFPSMNEAGEIVSAIGYRVAPRIREWDKPVVIWTRPSPEDFEVKGMNIARELIHAKTVH